MNKSDLKDGMMVKTLNAGIYLVFNNTLKDYIGELKLQRYEENLKHNEVESLDIIEVADARGVRGGISAMFEKYDNLPVLWQREIFNFKAGDKIQVKDDFSNLWENAYFLKKEENSDSPWRVTFRDEFTANMSFEDMIIENLGLLFQHARPYKEEE